MDMYEVSVAHDDNTWLFSGMRDLKTVRFEDYNGTFDLNASKNVAGFSHFENHTYVSLGTDSFAIIQTTKKNKVDPAYMIQANGKLLEFEDKGDEKFYSFQSYMPLHAEFHLPKRCTISVKPNPAIRSIKDETAIFKFKKAKKASFKLECKK
jgi:hypothetical protein